MPAPRLLDKKLVNASLASERKQEIDKGIKLAKSIDALRETREREEKELEELRVNTLRALQIEIDAKQRENEYLQNSNRELKQQRILLEGPIDLIEAWKEVSLLKEKNEEISDNLLKRTIDITRRENDVHDIQADIERRTTETIRSEEAADENLRQSETTRNEAKSVWEETEKFRSESHQEISQKKEELTNWEIALSLRDEEISGREERVQDAELDINREKILLADRRATLEQGFAELRRKQQN